VRARRIVKRLPFGQQVLEELAHRSAVLLLNRRLSTVCHHGQFKRQCRAEGVAILRDSQAGL
jgi:hypothetical protein